MPIRSTAVARADAPPFSLEPLEPRQLLAGVTIIAHGDTGSAPTVPWMDTMVAAIVDRAGTPTQDVTSLTLRLGEVGGLLTLTPGTVSGPRLDELRQTTGEVVIGLDWTAIDEKAADWDTGEVASFLATQLVNRVFPELAIPGPLLQLPVHLIGHDRGAPLVASLARELGLVGIWVDQVTTLDSHPAAGSADQSPVLYTNTIFADDYWRADGSGAGDPDGAPVAGSFENDLNAALGSAGTEHPLVHTYYHGTIDTAAATDGDGGAIAGAWYTGDPWSAARARSGFAFSLIGGDNRFWDEGGAPSPKDGVWTGLGGDGARTAFSSGELAAASWCNAGYLWMGAGRTLAVGQSVTTTYWHSDHNGPSFVQLFLDADRNPFNASARRSVGSLQVLPQSDLGGKSVDWVTPDVDPGSYYLYARVTDGMHTRYSYLPGAIRISNPHPDLDILTVAGARPWYTIGEQIEVTANIANLGSAPAAPFTLSYYLVPRGGAPTVANWIQDASFTEGLGAGATWPDKLDAWKSKAGTTPGYYRVWAFVDSYKVIPESNELNNLGASAEFYISSARPDLTVTKIEGVQPVYTAGQRVQASATIKNIGPGSAGVFTAAFFLSTESGVLLRRLDDDPNPWGVGPGSSYIERLGDGVSLGWAITGVTPGRYRIMLQADTYDALPEVNERNNWGWSSVFTVGAGLMAGRGPGSIGGDVEAPALGEFSATPDFHAMPPDSRTDPDAAGTDPANPPRRPLFDPSVDLAEAVGLGFFGSPRDHRDGRISIGYLADAAPQARPIILR